MDTNAHDAVTVPSSVITPLDSVRIGTAGADDRSMLMISEYAPNVASFPLPFASLTRIYHVLPVSSPDIFHALACVLLSRYDFGPSVDSQASAWSAQESSAFVASCHDQSNATRTVPGVSVIDSVTACGAAGIVPPYVAMSDLMSVETA